MQDAQALQRLVEGTRALARYAREHPRVRAATILGGFLIAGTQIKHRVDGSDGAAVKFGLFIVLCAGEQPFGLGPLGPKTAADHPAVIGREVAYAALLMQKAALAQPRPFRVRQNGRQVFHGAPEKNAFSRRDIGRFGLEHPAKRLGDTARVAQPLLLKPLRRFKFHPAAKGVVAMVEQGVALSLEGRCHGLWLLSIVGCLSSRSSFRLATSIFLSIGTESKVIFWRFSP